MGNWITVITFTYPLEANMAKSLLEASDINVVIKDELTVQVHNFYSNAIGGVKLLVEESQAQEALSILESAGYINKNKTEEKTKRETFSVEYKELCPYCSSTNTTPKYKLEYTYILGILPLPLYRKVYYCYDCFKEWNISKRSK